MAASERASQERLVEAKVSEAWMRAEVQDDWLPRATELAKRAALACPNNPRIRFYHACLQRREQRFAEAAAEFRKVLELDPTHSEARRALAQLERQVPQKRRTP
jgi:cytochrome c-type biogenesis protein CcmH/NrfG